MQKKTIPSWTPKTRLLKNKSKAYKARMLLYKMNIMDVKKVTLKILL